MPICIYMAGRRNDDSQLELKYIIYLGARSLEHLIPQMEQ